MNDLEEILQTALMIFLCTFAFIVGMGAALVVVKLMIRVVL